MQYWAGNSARGTPPCVERAWNSIMPVFDNHRRRTIRTDLTCGFRALAISMLLLGVGLGASPASAQDGNQATPSPSVEQPAVSPQPGIQESPSAPAAPQPPPASAPAAASDAAPSAPKSDAATEAQASEPVAPSSPVAPPAAERTDQPGGADTASPAGVEPAEPSTVDSDLLPQEDAAPAASAPRAVGSGTLPHDLSPWGMFMAADIVVKAVMIGLAFASVVTWTAWLAKSIELWIARRQLRRAIRRIDGATSLSQAAQDFASIRGTAGELVSEAAEEVERSLRLVGQIEESSVQERVTSRLSRVEAAANRRMLIGTGLLATIGSTAPFVGLFGTVWGIMNSFIGISQSQTTNLAVVAPGIAEALLATALGLVAAIPAVIIYNSFANRIAGYRLLLADASAGVERLVSLDLDVRRLTRGTRGLRAGSAAE